MKKTIKYMATWLWHPLVSWKLFVKGTRNFTILPQITINSFSFLSIGRDFYLGRNSRFLFVSEYRGEKYSPKVEIGNHVSIHNRFTVLSAAPISIGDDCLLASDVLITSENHGMDPESHASYADNPLVAMPVNIGKGCWIGEKAVILPGVTLGEKCIVAAGAVVNKSFPPYTIVAGVPAKAIKEYDFERHEWISVTKNKHNDKTS